MMCLSFIILEIVNKNRDNLKANAELLRNE